MSRRARRQAATAAVVPLVSRPAEGQRVGDATHLRPRGRPGFPHGWGRWLVLGTALYCAWIGRAEWATYRRLAAEEAQLRAQEARLRAEGAALQAEIAFAGTDAYVRSQARQLFGLVEPDAAPLAPLPPAAAGPGTSGPAGTRG